MNSYCNISVYLNKVTPTNYFKLYEEFNGKNIISKKELNKNNLQNKVESRLYLGSTSNFSVIFADANFNIDSINNDSEYELKAALCHLPNDVYDDIITLCSLKRLGFREFKFGTYLDSSPNEISKLKRNNNNMIIHENNKVKTVNSLKEFQESDYVGLHSLYLKNIKPLSLCIKIDENDNIEFSTKEDLEKKNVDKSQYNNTFVGEVDGKNILFSDNSFYTRELDSNHGHIIYGCKYEIKDKEFLKVPLVSDSSNKFVDIEPVFMFNSF